MSGWNKSEEAAAALRDKAVDDEIKAITQGINFTAVMAAAQDICNRAITLDTSIETMMAHYFATEVHIRYYSEMTGVDREDFELAMKSLEKWAKIAANLPPSPLGDK